MILGELEVFLAHAVGVEAGINIPLESEHRLARINRAERGFPLMIAFEVQFGDLAANML